MDYLFAGASNTYPNSVQAPDLTFTNSSGMWGLLGPNGSGKSTFREASS